METWILDRRDVAAVTALVGRDALMERVVERLTEGFADIGHGRRELSPLRGGFTRSEPVPGILEWMPHRDAGDSVTIKTVAYSPAIPPTSPCRRSSARSPATTTPPALSPR